MCDVIWASFFFPRSFLSHPWVTFISFNLIPPKCNSGVQIFMCRCPGCRSLHLRWVSSKSKREQNQQKLQRYWAQPRVNMYAWLLMKAPISVTMTTEGPFFRNSVVTHCKHLGTLRRPRRGICGRGCGKCISLDRGKAIYPRALQTTLKIPGWDTEVNPTC